jgi:hypothetical protein
MRDLLYFYSAWFQPQITHTLWTSSSKKGFKLNAYAHYWVQSAPSSNQRQWWRWHPLFSAALILPAKENRHILLVPRTHSGDVPLFN